MSRGIPVKVLNQFAPVPPEAYQGGYNNNAYAMLLVTRTALEAATNTSIGHLYALNGGFAPQPGKAAVVVAINFTSSKTVTMHGVVGIPVGPLSGVNVPTRVVTTVVKAGEIVRVPVNWVLRNGQQCTLYALNFMDAGDTEAWIGCHPEVYYITDDFNYGAAKTMAVYGTSITNGSGPSSTGNMYITKFKQYLRSQSVSVRYELYGISGSTSNQHVPYFEKGAYDITSQGKPPDIAVLEFAVNDASAGVATVTSIANYTALCRYFLMNPEKKQIRVLVLGATPLENNTASANAMILDAALEAMVAELVVEFPERIYYIKLSDAFDRLAAANYASTDTAGLRIHPSDQGSGLIFSVSMMNWLVSDDGQQFLTWAKR